ncbi:MAG: serine/threonine-protein kinase [Pirellula sp.]
MSLKPSQFDPLANSANSMAKAAEDLRELVGRGETTVATETILAHFPELQSDRDAILELLYLEHLYRQESGLESTSQALVQEFTQRFPDLQDELVKLFQVADAMSDADVLSSVHDFDTPFAGNVSTEEIEIDEPILGVIGDYLLLEEVGRGGMGVVYRAHQRSLGRIVAVKTLSSPDRLDQSELVRFQREAELASSLQHPNIVPIHEVGLSGGFPFFSMEYVEGGSLAEAIRNRPFRPEVAAQLMSIVARAVDFAHSKGVVHRDLKPGNILLAPSKRPEAILLSVQGLQRGTSVTSDVGKPSGILEAIRVEPKIVDFGLAMECSRSAEAANSKTAGTPSYMSPEQIDSTIGPVGPQSDVYSLGSVLYQLLVGRPPFCASSTQETLQQVCEDEPIPPRNLQRRIPIDLETICLKCLRKLPQTRYATALELADDLQRFLEAKPILAKPATLPEQVYKWGKRNPTLVVLISSMLIAVALTTWLWRRSEASLTAERIEKERGQQLIYIRDMSLAYSEQRAQNTERAKELLQSCRSDLRNWEWDFVDRLCNEPIWQSSPVSDQVLAAAALSPSGQHVVTGHGQWGTDRAQTIYVWDVDANKVIWKLEGHPACSIGSVSFSPDGKSILSSGMVWETPGKYCKVLEWELSTGKLRREYANVNACASLYDHSGQYVLVGDTRGVITVYARESGEKIREFKPHGQMVLSICLSTDERYVASSGRDGSVAIHELATGNEVFAMSKQGDTRVVEWSPDMSRIQVVKFTGEVTVYRWENNRMKRESSYVRPYGQRIEYAPDGQTYATAVFGEVADLRDAESGRILHRFAGHRGHIRDVSFDSKGRRLLTAGADGTCRIWDLQRPSPYQRSGSTSGGSIAAVDFRPGKQQFAIAFQRNKTQPLAYSGKPRIEIWSSNTLKREATLLGHQDWPTTFEYSADGRWLISGSLDCTVRLWDAESGKETGTFEGHRDRIAFASVLDSEQAISVDASGIAHLWSLETFDSIGSWSVSPQSVEGSQSSEVTAAAIHIRERILAAACNQSITFWDIDTFRKLGDGNTVADVNELQFSPDFKQLAIATNEKEVYVWNMDRIKSHGVVTPKHTLKGHRKSITSVAFSPDGKRLVTSSQDETIRLFDVTMGAELLKFEDARGEDNLVSFSNDGRKIIRVESSHFWLYSLDPMDEKNEMAPEEAARSWHMQRLTFAVLRFDHHASVFHGQIIAESQPNDLSYRYLLVQLLIDGGRLEEAKTVLQQIQPTTTSEHIQWLANLARVALKSETGSPKEIDAYNDYCHQLVQIPSNVPSEINAQLWTASLANNSTIDVDALIPAMEKLCLKRKDGIYYDTLALLYLRTGRYLDAIGTVEKSLKSKKPSPQPIAWIIRAISRCESERKLREQNAHKQQDTPVKGKLPELATLAGLSSIQSIAAEAQRRHRWHQLVQEDMDRIWSWMVKLDKNRVAGTRPGWADLRLEQLEIPLLLDELKTSMNTMSIRHQLLSRPSSLAPLSPSALNP